MTAWRCKGRCSVLHLSQGDTPVSFIRLSPEPSRAVLLHSLPGPGRGATSQTVAAILETTGPGSSLSTRTLQSDVLTKSKG